MNLVAAIETDRLRLAPVAAADEVALRRFFRNDHVRRFRREADICALG